MPIYYENQISNDDQQLQLHQHQSEDHYSVQSNILSEQSHLSSYNYYPQQLNQFSYSETLAVNNQMTTAGTTNNEYSTDSSIFHQISSAMQSNWNDETQIVDSICPINITYLPSFSTFFK